MLRKIAPKGFALVEVVIILLVIAALGLGGWFVWKKTHKDSPPNRSASVAQKSGDQSKSAMREEQKNEMPAYTYPEAKWNEYKNDRLGFTFYYPKDWGQIDVRFDGSGGFYLALFAPSGEWGQTEVYDRASIELRGHSVAKTQDNHGEFAKGFYKKDKEYFQVGGTDGDIPISGDKVISYDQDGLPTLLIKQINLVNYEALELMINLEGKSVLGLNLTLSHPMLDQFEGPAYSQKDIEVMKQIAASFKKL